MGYCSQCPNNLYCKDGGPVEKAVEAITGQPTTTINSDLKSYQIEVRPKMLSTSKRINPEAFYIQSYCKFIGGKSEVTLSDGTRVDCLTDTDAIEVEFANKYYEAVGQSLHYARVAKRNPKIALILERPSDKIYLLRLQGDLKYHTLQKITLDQIVLP